MTATRADVLASVRAALARGEYLEAYDLAGADDALADDLELAYLATLALARAGATRQATKLLVPLARAARDRSDVPDGLLEDIPALEARLAKDRALDARNGDRVAAARDAAQRYEAIYRRLGRPYTCVNAATMWLIAGERERAVELARAARALVAALGPEASNDEDAYWLAATDAEAALVLGDRAAADAALARASELVGDDLARAATTRKQLELICTEVRDDASLLDRLAAPRVVHYCGHMITPGPTGRFPADQEPAVAAAVADQVEGVALAYGSLACGADILYAEALLARGAEVHVHLPCEVDDFVAASVAPGGPGWIDRFRSCLDRAASVSIATAGPYLGDPALFAYCSRVAMGHALIRADFLAARAEQLAVWDRRPPAGPAGTAIDVEVWARTGRPTHVVEVGGAEAGTTNGGPAKAGGRKVRAMLFADLAGFGRLDDSHIPAFLDAVMQPLADVIDGFGDSVLFRNTWGDGIYLVFDDVAAAARCALQLQSDLEDVDLGAAGLPQHLAMRVAAHAGPVLEREDPVRRVPGFYGVEVTRAARMEPRTPEGAVYVTDQFAALLALEPDADVRCQYVGRLPSAKDFGTFPMYVLTHRR